MHDSGTNASSAHVDGAHVDGAHLNESHADSGKKHAHVDSALAQLTFLLAPLQCLIITNE